MSVIKPSLANTGKSYIEVQARMYSEGLHVQGRGHPGNRSYGIAVTLPVSDAVREFVSKNEKTKVSQDSLAGTSRKYFVMRVRPRPGYLHFQAPDGKDNREYGQAFDILREGSTANDLWVWAAEVLLPA